MASRFVSGGTITGTGGGDDGDSTLERGAAAAVQTSDKRERARQGGGAGDSKNNALSVEWEAVQKDLDEERRRRTEARRAAGEGGERSLYEVLQANKAAKQAAFEEQNRIRNQFRALDDDEIEFLHGVSDERRAEEARVRRETEERLAGFREKQRATATSTNPVGSGDNGDVAAGGANAVGEEWAHTAAGRKRKREKDRDRGVLKGVVKRRTSSASAERKEDDGRRPSVRDERGDKTAPTTTTAAAEPAEPATSKKGAGAAPPPTAESAQSNTTQKSPLESKPKPAMGLVDYGSDEDDD